MNTTNNIFEKLFYHLIAMGNLDGKAIDYPVMFIAYLGIFVACLITTVLIIFSKHGKRIVWLPDQHKIIKSRFSYMAMLACTFTGVFLVGSFPAELQNTYGTWNVDFFYTMLNIEPWQEWITNPYWWYFESSVVSWSVFCGRFVAYCSNGYSVRDVIKYGTFSLIVLTVVWHIASAATGYTLGLSRGPAIYILAASCGCKAC